MFHTKSYPNYTYKREAETISTSTGDRAVYNQLAADELLNENDDREFYCTMYDDVMKTKKKKKPRVNEMKFKKIY